MNTSEDRIYRGACWPLLLFASLVLICAGGGCIDVEQVLILAPDGALTCTIHYSLSEELMPHAEASQKLLEDWQEVDDENGLRWMFNEQSVRNYLAGENIIIDNYNTYTEAGRRHAVVTCTAKDAGRALETRVFGDFQVSHDSNANTTTIRSLVAAPPGGAEATLDEDGFAVLRELAKGLRLRLELQTPAAVLKTTGEKIAEDRVEWVFDADENADFLRKAPDISVTFKGTLPQPKNDGAENDPQ